MWSRVRILIRRIHLYTGLFLLPWVFLYGITGAMFNHQGLFPVAPFTSVDKQVVANSALKSFPSAEQMAQQVVDALQRSADGQQIALLPEHGAEFTNALLFETRASGVRHVVHLDPVNQSAAVQSHPGNPEEPELMLTEIRNITLEPNPFEAAQTSASQVLDHVGIRSGNPPAPLGWSKLNFLATVDQQPVRVTYVLKDGHIDVSRYTGEDGMTLRQFLLRLHTSHGQPPHWNGRMYWSVIVDVMAIAMVAWGITGLFMWWQLKRSRVIGAAVIGCSVVTAVFLYVSLHGFYATTKL
ncbi:MAG: PepSY domain-containing protein [Planctomycetaceae bacterium]